MTTRVERALASCSSRVRMASIDSMTGVPSSSDSPLGPTRCRSRCGMRGTAPTTRMPRPRLISPAERTRRLRYSSSARPTQTAKSTASGATAVAEHLLLEVLLHQLGVLEGGVRGAPCNSTRSRSSRLPMSSTIFSSRLMASASCSYSEAHTGVLAARPERVLMSPAIRVVQRLQRLHLLLQLLADDGRIIVGRRRRDLLADVLAFAINSFLRLASSSRAASTFGRRTVMPMYVGR